MNPHLQHETNVLVPEHRLSDEVLVKSARGHSQSAVRELTRRHNRRLYRMARSILRNDSEAEDVVQEAYVRAFTHLDDFRGELSFATWLTRIAMNEALGRLRRRRTAIVWGPEEESRIQAEIIQFPAMAADTDPERSMAVRQISNLLEQAIDDLPDTFRTVFVARVVEGMSMEETGELLGLKPETVKTRLHRARRILRKDLDAKVGTALLDTFPFDGRRCSGLTEAVIKRLSFLP